MKLENDYCAHYLTPDFSEAFLSEPEVQVYIEQPYPVCKPLKSTGVDIIQKYHEDRESYFHKLSTLHKNFHLVKDKIINQSFDNSHVTITKGLLNFCNTERYQAPFTCDYNPFYGTGSLELFTLNNSKYLVRPDSKNNLRISNVEKPWKNNRLKLETALNEHEHITGISSTITESDILLLLQLTDEINLLKISDTAEAAEIQLKKKFKRPILDSKFDESKFGVVLFDTKFRLYDLKTNKKIILKDHNVDSVIKLEFVDHSNMALLSQNTLKMIDQRSEDCRLFKPELEECNRLCSLKIDDNEVYLGSRHHLIRTDVRFFKSVEFCTHLMKTSPCYIDCVENRNKILCLSGQRYGDKALFTGNPIGSLPFNVPSIYDTLTECRLRNDILLKDHLDERLQSSTSGLKLVCDNDGVDLYTSNCFGDIFKQRISNTVEESGVDSINSLYKWVQKLPESPKTLNLTNVIDMSRARFALNKRIMEENLERFTKKNKRAKLFLNHYNSIYDKRNLSNLAANFVTIWEDEEEREEADLVPEVAPIDKVSSWIESSYFFE